MKRAIFLWLSFILAFTMLHPVSQSSNAQIANPSKSEGSPATVDETPIALVPGGVTSYTLAAPKVFWHTGVPVCPSTRTGASDVLSIAPDAPQEQYAETIKRIAALGSPLRTLYLQLQNCSSGQILSGMAADNIYIYYFNPTGLMQLSILANPGDSPLITNANVDAPGELVDGGDRVFYISNNTGGASTKVGYVWKDTHSKVDAVSPGAQARNLSFDGEYFYYMVGSTLYRYSITTYTQIAVTTGVTGYLAEGKRLLYCSVDPYQCYYSRTIFIAKGRFIYTYSNNTDTLNPTPVYTSVDTSASIYALISDLTQLFFFEQRTVECGDLLCTYNYLLQRTLRSGGAADSLFTYGPTVFSGPTNLKTTDDFLFWHEADKVQRLPKNASALPMINMYTTGMEITQGIQNISNSVLLVKNRKTFVRLYVKSAGAAVPGVSALLSSPTSGLGPLVPVNTTGTKITVRSNPVRNDLEQSFLFELPWSWVQGSSLDLRAELNPYKVPLEPNYADNTASISVPLVESPSMSAEFFRLNYTINFTTYRPRIQEDVLRTFNWIMRTYPIGGAVSENFKPRLWDVAGGPLLGSYVNGTNWFCSKVYNDPQDDITLCASYVTNGWLWSYRIQTMMGWVNTGLSPNAFYYGMISDTSNYFPRGQARFDRISVGPAGTPGQFFSLGQGWDTDGTYADWYAAHEIGHTLGRAHPNAGSDDPDTANVFENCGHSRSDSAYPYGSINTARTPIGSSDNTMEGFDIGIPLFGNITMGRAVLPSNNWNDVMSYCANKWISDYTYTAMYNFLIAHPSLASAPQINTLPQAGDWLALSGVIDPSAPDAAFSLLKRLDNVINTPVINPGVYRLRLLNATQDQLSSQDFSSEMMGDDNVESFALVVPFLAGTRFVELSKVRDGVVLALQPVSANPPIISGVALAGAPNPVTGVVTLGWNASDPDNDPLTFEVAYSMDNGVSFQPVAAGISGLTTLIDTGSLGGSGTAVLRVMASDGVNTAYADSAPFNMGVKEPIPYILDPVDGLHVQYGQLVNFSGIAMDAQDGLVAEDGLTWTDAFGSTLAVGSEFSSDNLPVGENLIKLRAINSKGILGIASTTVFVGDDLSLPGPTLTVAPTNIAWQVGSGVTTLQTAEIVVNNSGGGSLTWTATDDAAWLTLSSAGGSISDGDPQSIILTGDPSGMPGGATQTAHVTITKAAGETDPVQVVTVLVTFSIGDVWSGPPAIPPPTSWIYLPLVKR